MLFFENFNIFEQKSGKMGKMKKCSVCKKLLGPMFFGHNSCSKDGLRSDCKVCVAVGNKAQRQQKLYMRYGKDPKIELCSCGSYFDKSPSGGLSSKEKPACMDCRKRLPLVKVYVPELKKCIWARRVE